MKTGIDFIGVSAGAVIVDDEGKYFLARRGPDARDDVGTWEFPGGTINIFETREGAAVRNIKEKHGMQITICKTLGVYDVIDKQAGDHWVSTTYLCKITGDTKPSILKPKKCDDIDWFSIDEIKQLKLSRISALNLVDIANVVAKNGSA